MSKRKRENPSRKQSTTNFLFESKKRKIWPGGVSVSGGVSTLSRRSARPQLRGGAQNLSEITARNINTFIEKRDPKTWLRQFMDNKNKVYPDVQSANRRKVSRVLAGHNDERQRFPIEHLSWNPRGKEAKWVVTNNPMPPLVTRGATNGVPLTTLYHSSEEALEWQQGNIVRTRGVTWHHTFPLWRFFKNKEKSRVQILIPTSTLNNALKSQFIVNFAGDPAKAIRQAIVSGKKWVDVGQDSPNNGRRLQHNNLARALELKNTFTQAEWNAFKITNLRKNDYIRSNGKYYQPVRSKIPDSVSDNRPLLTRYKTMKNVAPGGVANGRSYVTVLMPPFEAEVINVNGKTNNKIYTLRFLGFTNPKGTALKGLFNKRRMNSIKKKQDSLDKRITRIKDRFYVLLLNLPEHLTYRDKYGDMYGSDEKDTKVLKDIDKVMPETRNDYLKLLERKRKLLLHKMNLPSNTTAENISRLRVKINNLTKNYVNEDPINELYYLLDDPHFKNAWQNAVGRNAKTRTRTQQMLENMTNYFKYRFKSDLKERKDNEMNWLQTYLKVRKDNVLLQKIDTVSRSPSK